jgi:NAD(P)-dependent dehydrogenase (short-subunit alcohol dehydrogenase family)
MSWSLQGRTAFVTGAARGIGADAAQRLSARGMNVVLAGLEPDQLERAAASCPGETLCLELDVTDREALEGAVARTVERFGGIDVAIVNAGIGSGGTVRWTRAEDWERVIEVNLLGSFRTIRACLPHVVERRGYVLQVASMASALHAPNMSAYAASKAGVEALADSLRLEVAHLGVGVGCAYFSWVSTEMVEGARRDAIQGRLFERLPGPLARRYPLSAAGEAVADGVARRARTIVVPGWARTLLLARRIVQGLSERSPMARMGEVDALQREAVEGGRHDEVSRPVGAGGEADARARAS